MKKISFIVGIILALSSCSSNFLKEYSQDLSRVRSFTDLDELIVGSGFLGVGLVANANYYIQIYNTNYLPVHFMSDELDENLTPATDPDRLNYRNLMYPYFTWQQSLYLDHRQKNTYEGTEQLYWNLSYTHIATCNMILAEAKQLAIKDEEEQKLADKVNGEAHFLRALYYYVLVNLYAKPYVPSTAASTPGIPVKLTEYIEDKEYVRNSVQEVYDQIINDLNDAEEYLSTLHSPQSIHRVSINAVYLLRSRVALYMQDWSNAKKYALLSLKENNKLQQMNGMEEDIFPLSKANVENVFSMGGTTLGSLLYTHPGGDYYGTPYSPVWKISDRLYALYDKDDTRKYTFFQTKYGEGNEPSYHKIDNSEKSLGIYKGVSDQFLFRSAEAYLNAAEACAQLGETQNATEYLTELRKYRVKNANAIALTGEELVKYIREEREREFCLEGQRWYDMRRYAVDQNYPEVFKVEHSFTTYASINNKIIPQQTNYYELTTDDGGMVLDIPKSVKDFQQNIGSNIRPFREVVKSKVY
ncbi:RagB/SusD family nutrient uptake outer membrane protein [uncultured Bacteroides sp.]|uniref:RagB/SusD family nutrient uptake outer membrane protein n=1 Tax=uncultured Bacteroides sp. TaxID=162156 RepID=UPI002AAAF9C2|nr:RagB/SusD family nutrient uptake outer membrane protein [uncultured Bacteroides sp.]